MNGSWPLSLTVPFREGTLRAARPNGRSKPVRPSLRQGFAARENTTDQHLLTIANRHCAPHNLCSAATGKLSTDL